MKIFEKFKMAMKIAQINSDINDCFKEEKSINSFEKFDCEPIFRGYFQAKRNELICDRRKEQLKATRVSVKKSILKIPEDKRSQEMKDFLEVFSFLNVGDEQEKTHER